MTQIEIDFEVFKALTAMRPSEAVSYNDVIRELLGLEKALGRAINETLVGKPPSDRKGYSFRGLFLPDGTKIRVVYKGNTYTAEIKGGRWIDQEGVEHVSPSAAARYVTGNSVNGLLFWSAKRPNDSGWKKLNALSGFSQ
jgi:hypothetical protein